MPGAAPFVIGPLEIEKDWIDYNGHMNMGYYGVMFDRAADTAFAELGLGRAYAQATGFTTYTAEFHVCYVRELHLGDAITSTFHLLDYDEKRLHAYQELRHGDGWLAATGETLSLHIDASGPKVAPFPADIIERLEAMKAAHARLPRPERAGRSIGIPRRNRTERNPAAAPNPP